MPPLTFRYLSFQESLLKPEEWSGRNALILFRTEAGRNAARRQIQSCWQLNRLHLMTLAEFKDLLFLAPRPLLKEEKRALAFYASLDAQARDFFHINTYFQSIDLLNKFFSLWEECSEARLDLEIAAGILASAGAELYPWQEKTLLQLFRIRDRYRDWITRRGFTDQIFIQQEEYLDFSFLTPFDHVFWVNPIQLSTLEKWILDRLQEKMAQVTLLLQMPPQLMDESTLELRPFSAHDLEGPGRQYITLWECCNAFSLYARFVETAFQQQIRHVVDVNNQPCAFHHFLSPEKFRLPASTAMSETSVYHFLAVIGGLLEELVHDSQTGRLLVPLPALLDALQNRAFYLPLVEPGNPGQNVYQQEKAITLLHELQSDDFLYLDLDGRFFVSHERRRRELEPLLQPILRLLHKILEVQDLAGFSRFIDDPECVPLRRILTAVESNSSNLLEQFYQVFADFNAIGELGIIDSWRTLFTAESQSAVAGGMLRLFLEYIKSVRVRFEWNVDRQDQIEFTAFSDAFELNFDRLALLQIVEGQLPRARSIPWLFTDQQRGLLGLDTYDRSRLGEKYAFFRLAMTTSELHLFTIRNLDKNIESSSFVEELRLAFPDRVEFRPLTDITYREFSQQLFKAAPGRPLPLPVRDQPDFFTLPFAAGRDFPGGEWHLSFYSYDQLRSNPFAYCVYAISGVPEWPEVWPAEMNYKLLGKVAQTVFDLCWKSFNADALPFSGFMKIFDRYGETAITRLCSDNSDYYYKLPKNHDLSYFREFTLPVIRSSCGYFFRQLQTYYHIHHDLLRVYPESEFSSVTEKTPKLYVAAAESGLPMDLLLTGRADLRIEYGEPVSAFLVDYKTGKNPDEDQLWFYELFYYLIDDLGMADRVRSCFYLILEQRFTSYIKKMKKYSKQEYLEKLRMEMIQNLQQVCMGGYSPPARRTTANKLGEIIRIDIYHPR